MDLRKFINRQGKPTIELLAFFPFLFFNLRFLPQLASSPEAYDNYSLIKN